MSDLTIPYDVVVVGSGFGGSVTALRLTEKGYRVGVLEAGRRFSRETLPKNSWDLKNYLWAPRLGMYGIQRIHLLGNVMVLAGAGVGDRRWTEAYKKRVRDSRVLGTAALAGAVASLDEPPRVFINGSAMGFYGETGQREVDESAPPGDGFLPSLCVEWEGAAAPAREAGVRTVFTRTGLVVSRDGGAWGKLFPLFQAGLGGRLGDGRQYWSFIALHDEVAALRHLLDTDGLSGPCNLTAPHPATNREVTAAMGQVLRRPTPFAVPAPVLRAVLGEMGGEVLGSARVRPTRLLESGFRFAFPEVQEAIRAAL